MRPILCSELITIPSEVTLTFEQRTVTVVGPRGTLVKSFKHIPIEMIRVSEDTLKLNMWFGTKLQTSTVRTLATHIKNMIKGTTVGFKYIMKVVYAHFPINVVIDDDKHGVEIRNFLGEKYVRKLIFSKDVSVENSAKDEICILGNDVDLVSLAAAKIHQSVLVKNKDIRKFLDGIYVSTKTTIIEQSA